MFALRERPLKRAAWTALMDCSVGPITAGYLRSRANRFTASTGEAGAKDKSSINTAGDAPERSFVCSCLFVFSFIDAQTTNT